MLLFRFVILLLIFNACQSQVQKVESSDQSEPISKPLIKEITPTKVDTTFRFTSRIGIIFEDSQGNIWIVSKEEGLCKYDGAHFTYYGEKQGLGAVRAIYEDQKGRIYFGLDRAVSVLDASALTTIYPKKESLLITESLSTTEDDFEAVWKQEQAHFWFSAFNKNGVYRFDGAKLVHLTLPVPDNYPKYDENGYHPEHGYDLYAVYGIYKGPDDHLYFGTAGAGLFRYDGQSIIGINEDIEKGVVRAIHKDQTGMLWFGNNALGIIQYDGQQLTNFSKQRALFKEGLAGALDILEDKEGRLWFATYDAGLWRYDPRADRQGSFSFVARPEDVVSFTQEDGLSTNTITCLLEDGQGRLWVGTERGDVFIFTDGHFEQFFR